MDAYVRIGTVCLFILYSKYALANILYKLEYTTDFVLSHRACYDGQNRRGGGDDNSRCN